MEKGIKSISDFLKNVPICKVGTHDIVGTTDLSLLQRAEPQEYLVFGCFLDIDGNLGCPGEHYVYEGEVYEIKSLRLNQLGNALVDSYFLRRKEHISRPIEYVHGKCNITNIVPTF